MRVTEGRLMPNRKVFVLAGGETSPRSAASAFAVAGFKLIGGHAENCTIEPEFSFDGGS